MRKFGLSEIQSVMQSKGYKFFTEGVYNLNLIGVRSSQSQSDKFDDHFHLIYRANDSKYYKHFIFPFTSDPGKHWLLNPLNKNGTAILIPNQYRGVYKLGIHGRSWSSGGYEALEQVKPMDYVRDNNKDSVLDFSLYQDLNKRKAHKFTANIKSNIHRASRWKTVLNVGRYSAACQVLQNYQDFETLRAACHWASRLWGNSFSYTLLEQKDFE